MINNHGDVIAQAALQYPNSDTRAYGAMAPQVDCSMFVAEVYSKSGYLLPREATAQAAWFKKNGSYSTDLKSLQIGDAAYWDRGAGKYHTGIIVQVLPVVLVVHATSNKGKANCIKKNELRPNGIIVYWTFPFVGAGRIK